MNNPLIFTDPSGYRPDLIFEEEATASVYLFLGMGSYQDNKTALRKDILGNYEVWLPLFTAIYGGYFTQMIAANSGGILGGWGGSELGGGALGAFIQLEALSF